MGYYTFYELDVRQENNAVFSEDDLAAEIDKMNVFEDYGTGLKSISIRMRMFHEDN